MKDAKKQREKVESDVKTKSPHSIRAPSTSSPSTSSNVLKITKKSHAIQKRTVDKSNSVQTKLMSVKNENGTKSVIVSKINAKSPATSAVKPPTTAAKLLTTASTAQPAVVNNARIGKRLVRTDDSKRVATQVESRVSVEHSAKNFRYQNKLINNRNRQIQLVRNCILFFAENCCYTAKNRRHCGRSEGEKTGRCSESAETIANKCQSNQLQIL